jgi:hypothetical protein
MEIGRRAHVALLSLFALVVLVAAVPACGGAVEPPGPSDEAHVVIDLTPSKVGGQGAGLPWLEPAIARADADAMVGAFDWRNTAPIRETDQDGAPALYYATIYLTSREQRAILDQAGIHHSFMPLFEDEQQKWNGKTGRMSQSTTGKGALVFAVVPGRIYNVVRHWALAGDPLFAAILLRSAPAGATNAEGSLSYDYLAQAAFKYRGMDPLREASGTGTSQQKLVILTVRLALKAVAETAEEIPRAIARALGNRDREGLLFGWGAAGSVALRLTLDVLDTDPKFDGSGMRRAWGKDAGIPVMLPGVRLSVWSRGDSTVLGLPTLFEATTNGASVATFNLAKDRRVRQLCIATENDAAELTDFLTEIEVCTFEGSVDKTIDFLKTDTWANVKVQDSHFNILAQATEARAYLQGVVGYTPHKAVINVGWIADAMGKIGTGGPFAPCLGFPNVSADIIVIQLLGNIAAIPVVGPPLAVALGAVTPLLAVDMFFPDSDALLSRGVATHEYGHFAMCSMLYDAHVSYISTSWTSAVADRIASGAIPPPTASGAYDIEAFADFFAGQVVGGTNYFQPGTLSGGAMSYCDVNGGGAQHDDCLDHNYSSATDFRGQVARVATTLHDAFDGVRFNSSFVNQPGNGNVWTTSPTGFVYAGDSRNGDQFDEEVLLPGAAMRSFVGKLSSLGAPTFMTSLAQTIRENGYTWCQTCRVFSLHDGVAKSAPAADHYAACARAPIAPWVGPAPDTTNPASCNFTQCPYPLVQVTDHCEPCAANQISVGGTTCQTCPPGTTVVSNQCKTCNNGVCVDACPERQHLVNGVCQDCPFTEVSVAGVCQPCPAGLLRHNNECVTTCPPELDKTVIVDGVCTYWLL